MKAIKFLHRGIFALGFSAGVAGADVTQHDTTGPDRFEFAQPVYIVAENATNALITIRFYPGNRGWAGGVTFMMGGGSATAGQDYLDKSGFKYFSGYGPHVVRVPIIWDEKPEREETVHLSLVGGPRTYVGPTGGATLRITNVRSEPRLRLAFGSGDQVTISWLNDGVTRVLERTESPGSGQWTAMTNATVLILGNCIVRDTRSPSPTFYRLRRQ